MTSGRIAVRLIPLLLIVGALGLLQSVLPAPAQDPASSPAVWFSDHKTLKGIDPAANQVVRVVPLAQEADALAMDPGDGALWVLAHKQLLKFDASGNLLLDLDLKGFAKPFEEPKLLALDPYDGSVWIAGEKGLLHLDSQGGQLHTWESPDPIRSLGLDLDESLWVLTKKHLIRLSPQAAVLQSLDLQGVIHDPRHLAVDALGGALWISGEKSLFRFDRNDPTRPPQEIPLPLAETGHGKEMGKMGGEDTEIAALALHPILGTLYVAAKDGLVLVDRAGNILRTVDLAPFGIGKVESLAFEPGSLSLWLGGKEGVARFTPEGDFVAKVPVEKEAEALGAAPPSLLPVLTLIEPPDGSVTNNSKPPIRLGLGTTLNGVSRELGDSYFSSLVFEAELNAQPVGSLFAVRGREASYTPVQPLAEGENLFSVQATDLFGRKSNRIASRFTVDTVPPRFGGIAPADGSLVATPTVTIQGSVDDPNASVILKDQAGKTLGTGGASFSFPVALALGLNTFVLHATDSAGNTAEATVRITRSGLALQITSPANNSTVGTPQVSVEGTFSSTEPIGEILVWGLRAEIAGNTFKAPVVLGPGINTIAVTARDIRGNQASASVDVTLRESPPPAGAEARGVIHGTVYHAVSKSPLADAEVLAKGLAYRIRTDAAGRFAYPVPEEGGYAIYVEKHGFVEARRSAFVIAGRETSVEPVYLVPFDSRATDILASEGGRHTDSTGMVEVIIPPGALPRDLRIGATYISTGEAFPLPIPYGDNYIAGVQFTPEYVSFNEPVTVRIRNTLGFKPGTNIPFAYASHDVEDQNADFYDPGMGVVTADGLYIEYKLPHFSCMVSTLPGPPDNPPDTDDDESEEDDDCDEGNCWVGVSSGRLFVDHLLPSYKVLGKKTSLSLLYDSGSVYRRFSVGARSRLRTASATPLATSFTASHGASVISAHFLGADQEQRFRALLDEMSENPSLASGIYYPAFSVSNKFSGVFYAADAFGGPGKSPTEVPLPAPAVSTTKSGKAKSLVNRIDSPFGAGWTLSGYERLHVNPDGNILLTQGARSKIFKQAWSVQPKATGLRNPRGIVTNAEGKVFVADYTDGAVFQMDPSSGKTSLFAKTGCGVKGLTIDPGGNVYAISTYGGIQKISPSGVVTPHATVPNGHLEDTAIDSLGNLYVVNGNPGILFKVSPAGLVSELARGFVNPISLAVDKDDNVYVSNNNNTWGNVRCGVSYISKVTPAGSVSTYHSGLNNPRGITFDAAGNLYVADATCDGKADHHLYRIAPSGLREKLSDRSVGSAKNYYLVFGLAFDMAVSPAGEIYAASTDTGAVFSMNPALSSQTYFSPPGDYSVLTREADGTFTRTLKDGTVVRYGPTGLMTEKRDRNGNAYAYAHDTDGKLVSITDPLGRITTFDYAGGKLSSITDPFGRATTFSHDASWNLLSVAAPDGAVTTYSYDSRRLMTAKKLPGGEAYEYEYDGYGAVAAVRAPTGETRRYQPASVQKLINDIPPGQGTPENPAPPVLAAEIASRVTDGKGGVRSVRRDKTGVVERTDPLGRTTKYVRDVNGNPTEVTRPDESVVLTAYDERGNLIRRTDPLGNTIWLTYEPLFSQVAEITDPRWYKTRFTYDGRGNLVSVTDPLNNQTISSYNAQGLVTAVTDAQGHTTQYLYDAALQLSAVIDRMGFATNFLHDGRGNTTSVIDAKGNASLYEYDLLDRPVRMTDPSGAVTALTYDAGTRCECGAGNPTGNLTRVTDAKGNATRFEYSSIGLLSKSTDPVGHVKTYNWDLSRNLASVTDPNGNTVFYDYDSTNRVIRKTTPEGETTFSYDAMSNLVTASNPDIAYTFGYDEAGRNTSVADSYGKTMDFEYDGSGNRTRGPMSASGVASSYYHDGLNRLVWVSSGLLNSSTPLAYTYDSLGRRTRASILNTLSVDYTYDPLSRVIRMADANAATRDYAYDELGRRVYEAAAATAQPRLALSLDRTEVTEETLAVTGKVRGGAATVAVYGQPMSVDGSGNVTGTVSLPLGSSSIAVSVTDSKGAVSTRETWIYRWPLATGANIGKVSAVAPNGDVYVIENEVVVGSAPWAVALLAWIPGGAMIPAGSGTLTRPAWLIPAVDVSVDSAGRVYTVRIDGTLWLHDASGDQQIADLAALGITDMEVGPDDKVYVAAGNTVYRIEAGSPVVYATLPPEATSVSLDSSSWGLVAIDHANGVFYRVESGSATPFFSPGFYILDFAVDPAGTVCYEGEGWECRRQDDSYDFPSLQGPSLAFSPGGLMYVSTWDNVWKLEGVVQTPLITGVPVSGTLTVTASVFASETTANYTYNSRSELVQVVRHPVGEEAYAYDPTGNRTSDHRASDYLFNEVNQLTAGAGAIYTHDANGNRLSELRTLTSELTKYTWSAENRLKRIDFPDGRVAEYAYDPFGRRIQKKLTAPDGTETIRRYVYDREDIILELDASNNIVAEYLHGPGIDEPIALRRNGQTYYYHQDALGSIVAITDSAGSLVQRYEYDAYGAITYVLDPDFKQPYGFTGREYDEESGLYYYRARYYDPRTGRFLSKDPIGFAGGDVNLYGYVTNDPVNLIDPMGRDIIINNTGVPIVVGGNPGPGHGSGDPQYGIVPPDGKQYGGKDNPIPSWKDKEIAQRAAEGGQCPLPDGKIDDVDTYIDPKTGEERKVRGDDQGPITTLGKDKDGNTTVSRTGVPQAVYRYFRRWF